MTRTLALTASFLIPVTAFAGKQASVAGDDDGDGVINAWDVCHGSDDTVDLDGNGVADCDETLVPGAHFDVWNDWQQWEQLGPGANWSTWSWNIDGNAWTHSGSASIGASQGMGWWITSACIPVNDRYAYLLLFQTENVTWSTLHETEAQVFEYTSATDCQNKNSTNWHAQGTRAGAFTWSTSGGRFMPDVGTTHVRVRLHAQPQWPDNNYNMVARFDNVLLKPVGTEAKEETASTK